MSEESNMVKGIIFDMDNTLLRSAIDFAAMKREVFSYLTAKELLSKHIAIDQHTTSTLIEAAMQTVEMSEDDIREVWEIVASYESAGMQGAQLEEGVVQLLDQLSGQYTLIVITNNANRAAQEALTDHHIIHYFDDVIGRESMHATKPSSASFQAVMRQYAEYSSEQWISVGDSWIDGKAATGAGIAFIAYQADRQRLEEMDVKTLAHIDDIRELIHYL